MMLEPTYKAAKQIHPAAKEPKNPQVQLMITDPLCGCPGHWGWVLTHICKTVHDEENYAIKEETVYFHLFTRQSQIRIS